jgi:hypothetical protein
MLGLQNRTVGGLPRPVANTTAKEFQDYENLKYPFTAQITSNNSPGTSITAVLRDTQDAENALAVWLEAQKLLIE